MSNFTYITPTELLHKHPDIGQSLEELQALAAAEDKQCENCSQPVWKYAGLGLCFSCTTGESDASEDYELILEANNEH